MIVPCLILGMSSILFYIWTHTPYSFHFKHLTLSEYTIQRNHLHSIFTSSFVPINHQTLCSSLFLGLASAFHLATKFKARHFWCLFVINRSFSNKQCCFQSDSGSLPEERRSLQQRCLNETQDALAQFRIFSMFCKSYF